MISICICIISHCIRAEIASIDVDMIRAMKEHGHGCDRDCVEFHVVIVVVVVVVVDVEGLFWF